MVRVVLFLALFGYLVARADNERNGAAKEAAAQVADSGASSAAQAIAASQQAALMYRLLLTKGVMDYFQRKELERANQALARRVEKLQQELQAGKLSSAQYAAIKAAIEDTYSKYSKIEIPKDKEIQPLATAGEKSAKSNPFDFSSSTPFAKRDEGEKLKTELQRTDLAQLDSNPLGLSSQTGYELDKKALSKGEPEKKQALVNASESLGQGLVFSSAVQPQPLQGVSIQNTVTHESGLKSQPENLANVRGPAASAEFEGSGYQTIVNSIEEEALTNSEMERDYGTEASNFDQAAFTYNQLSTDSQSRSFLRNPFTPIRFQTNLFSTKLKTEEGIHVGFFVLVLGVAFFLGRKFNSSKKLPRVIPEVIISPQRTPRSNSTGLTTQTLHTKRGRSQIS